MWHDVRMTTPLTHETLLEALERYSPAILASLSGVHKRTLERIRAGTQQSSPWTLARVQPVLARLDRNRSKL